ncbi:MAG TPA: hypothetical protein VM577_09320 [Anaerovoracaceae bacterium]|nr:hypothetical protein [Anaerovoracaceae bacterium]
MNTQMKKAEQNQSVEVGSYLDEFETGLHEAEQAISAHVSNETPESVNLPPNPEVAVEPIKVQEPTDASQGFMKSYIEKKRVDEAADIEARLNVLKQSITAKFGAEEELRFEEIIASYVPEVGLKILQFALSQGFRANDPMLNLLHLTGFFNTVAQIIPDRIEVLLQVVVDLTEKMRADIRVEGGKNKEEFMVELREVLTTFIAGFEKIAQNINRQGSGIDSKQLEDSIAVVVGEILKKKMAEWSVSGASSKTGKLHDIGIFLIGVAATLFASGLHHFFF